MAKESFEPCRPGESEDSLGLCLIAGLTSSKTAHFPCNATAGQSLRVVSFEEELKAGIELSHGLGDATAPDTPQVTFQVLLRADFKNTIQIRDFKHLLYTVWDIHELELNPT